jgi:hypothetical protein
MTALRSEFLDRPVTRPTAHHVLAALSKSRLAEIAREFGLRLPERASRDEQARVLADAARPALADLLRLLGRDELRAACRAQGLDDSGRARAALMRRLLDAGDSPPSPIPAHAARRRTRADLPEPGDVVQARHRQWLVEEVVAPPEPGDTRLARELATLVRLVCLDDDNQGEPLELLWELELGARVLEPEAHGLGTPQRLDEPRRFGAYLHALKWNAVTATDVRLFQAPFRAGIKLMNHQLTPLRKALELPRANLFIADDVGLGKTIEAGLVLQELLLRQRVEVVLVVCPAVVALQWRGEMERRFGLSFELVNRDFVARCRQERGFQVNPWSTHQRFIVSYPTLRRPEYRDPLLQHLGDRARKSLLILDEAHTAAPATASKYAVDSNVTKVIRDVAPRFENRLFLSATPHNGHSNSFSALLEILDPQRFTRGVKVREPKQLASVMVRRLKDDLTRIGEAHFPLRRVRAIELAHGTDGWSMTTIEQGAAGEAPRRIGEPTPLRDGDAAELRLSELLREYREVAKPRGRRGRVALVRLQQRLLSSIEAFARTLTVHEKALAKAEAEKAPEPKQPELALRLRDASDEDEYGTPEDENDDADAAAVARASRELPAPDARARQLLDEMRELAARHRSAPDAKALALLAWIRANQCPAVRVGGADPAADRAWTDRRVIVFTEFAHTKAWLRRILATAIEGTECADQRILELHGGMPDEAREGSRAEGRTRAEVQRAWNAPPDQHPVRILLATDAAREGLNLQAHCADLFHFDLPWNPARLEQRNGRIDRTLQPAPEVRCHYFHYPQRREDVVLEKLVAKVETIRKELGSLSAVLMDRMGELLEEEGIGEDTAAALAAAEAAGGHKAAVEEELEAQRTREAALRAEIEEAGEILNRSRKVLDFDPELLRDAIDVGLELVAPGRRLTPVDGETGAWRVPELPDSWQPTLDSLRPPRARDEALWDWRRRPLDPVVFRPPERIESGRVHLHLQHPFVQRLLARFRAQGYSAFDLSRVAVLRNRRDSLARAIAFGRLSLFGPGATRLHDEIVQVAARWTPGAGGGRLRPFAEEADRKAVELFETILAEAPALEAVSAATRKLCLESAPAVFAELWQPLREEAASRGHEAKRRLRARGRAEADALRGILEQQRDTIRAAILEREQLTLAFEDSEREQREQFEHDRKHMEERLAAIDQELATQPEELEALYRVALTRIEPVGLVFLWPETRA